MFYLFAIAMAFLILLLGTVVLMVESRNEDTVIWLVLSVSLLILLAYVIDGMVTLSMAGASAVR